MSGWQPTWRSRRAPERRPDVRLPRPARDRRREAQTTRPARERGGDAQLPPQVYVDERPAEHFERYHEWARSHRPDWVQDLVRLIALPLSMLVYRVWPQGDRLVPQAGPAIIAANHFSAMDHFFCGAYLRRRVRFMAKSQLFKGPLSPILQHAGAFPVRRGRGDEEAIATALRILQGGGVVVLYPEGGRSRGRSIGDRARPGVGRLALQSGAPVVPVAIHGSMRVRNWKRLKFPRVRIRYGEPMRFGRREGSDRAEQQAVADQVLAAVKALYGELGEQAAAAKPSRGAIARRPAPR